MANVGEVRYKAKVDPSDLDKDIKNVESELKSSGEKAGDSMGDGIADGLKKGIEKGAEQAKAPAENAGKGIGALVKSEFAGQVQELSAQLASVGQDLVKTGLDYNMTLESYQMNFATLLGNAATAQTLVSQLSDMARKTPFNTNNLADAAQMLLTVGYSADEVMPMLQMLGDVSLGNTEKMGAMALAMSQISSAGKLQAQDLNQLINAGFNPLQEISEMTGKSMADLREDMESGAISAEMVTEAFEHATGEGGKFYNAINNAGETTAGTIANLQETFAALLGKMTEGLIPAIQVVVNWLSNLVGWISENQTAAAAIGAAIVALTASLTALSVIMGVVAPLMLAFGAGFTAVLGPIAAVIAIIAVVAAAITALALNFDEVKATVTEWASSVASTISSWAASALGTLGQWWKSAKQGFSDMVQNTRTAFSNFASAAKEAASKAWNEFKSIDWIELGKNIISGIVNGLKNSAGKLASAAMDAAKSAFNAAKNFLGIASPSKKFKFLGEMSGEGFEQGFAGSMESAKKQAQISVADALGGAAMGAVSNIPTTSLSNSVTFSGGAQMPNARIEVPVSIDGREVARATAWYMGEQLAWEER